MLGGRFDKVATAATQIANRLQPNMRAKLSQQAAASNVRRDMKPLGKGTICFHVVHRSRLCASPPEGPTPCRRE